MRVVESHPPPSMAALGRSLRALARIGRRTARKHDLDARDPSFIEDMQPFMGLLYDHYFRCETEVASDLPEGPCLVVANHNGMTGTPDMFCHMTAFWRMTSTSRLAYGLMHDMPFSIPAAGAWLNAAGAIAARPENGRRALERGATVLVFPGGDMDSGKPWSARYEIRFGGRRGFVRLALEMGVPIVPMVSVGAHESLFILTDGAKLAERLGLKARFRMNVAPIGFALPWGLVVGVPYPHLPPPVKIHTRIGKAIHFGQPATAASDPAIVEACFDKVMTQMRSMMHALRVEGRHGLFPAKRSRPVAEGRSKNASARQAQASEVA